MGRLKYYNTDTSEWEPVLENQFSSTSQSEDMTGTVNGSNALFTTSAPFAAIDVYVNGVHMRPGAGADYTVTGVNQITFNSGAIPVTGSVNASYHTSNSGIIVGTDSLVMKDFPSGFRNGTNTTFTTTTSYVPGSLQVYVNGLAQSSYATETSPSTGVFDLDVPPIVTDNVRASYQHSGSVSGNADTVDGHHATSIPIVGEIPVIDANSALLANPYISYVINGGCEIAQRVTAPSLSGTSQYGKVDRFRVHAGGTVGAGTVTQGTAQSFSKTGYTLHASGVTLTGSGTVVMKHRIESKNASHLKNLAGSFSAVVYHDKGSNVDYTITVRKATATDNFASVTDIQASSPITVPTATATRIKLENITLGDVTNGIEIEISAACGAVTTKNFHFCDVMFNQGVIAMGFTPRSFDAELDACQRYYEKSYLYADAPGTTYADLYINAAHHRDVGGGNAFLMATAYFKTRKRTAPTMAWYNPTTGAGTTHARAGGVAGTNYTTMGTNHSNETTAVFGFTTSSGDFHIGSCWTADAEL